MLLNTFFRNVSKCSKIKVNVNSKYNSYKLQKKYISSTRILKNKEYTDSEEWLCHQIDSTKIGLSKKALDELSDLVYIEYEFKKGDIVKQNEDLVMVESVKATNSIIAPFDLILLENNENIEDNLDIVNEDPEDIENSWFVKVDRLH